MNLNQVDIIHSNINQKKNTFCQEILLKMSFVMTHEQPQCVYAVTCQIIAAWGPSQYKDVVLPI